MFTPLFVQIHSLHSYTAALLNRDDSGLAKRVRFGGAVRTRISSQCLKRHWRISRGESALADIPGIETSVRSRNIVDRLIIAPMQESGDFNEDVLTAVGSAFNTGVYGSADGGRQTLLLGHPEVEHLRQRAQAICEASPDDAETAAAAVDTLFSSRRGEGRNFRALLRGARLPYGIEAALFGRMVSSDMAANTDAAIHVSHSVTVHAEETESEFFSVVDDLQRLDEQGASYLGETEVTSGLYYGYVVVDVPQLVANIEGCRPDEWASEEVDRSIAGQVMDRLVHLIATVTPGAKLGSTAPYGYADLMMVEAGSQVPRSLVNAFRRPSPTADRGCSSRPVRLHGCHR